MVDPNAQIRELINSLERFTRSQSNAASRAEQERERKWKQEKRLHAETDQLVESITKGRKLNIQQLELEGKLRDAKLKELKLAKDIERAQKDLLKAQQDHGVNSKEADDAQFLLSHAQKQHGKAIIETNKQSLKLANSFKGLLKGFNLAGAALTFFGAAIKNSINLARDQMVANQGLIEGTSYLSGMMTQQGEAFKRGIDPVEFAKMTTANRQMVNAMGGTTNAFGVLESSALDLYTMTGSQAEAYKLLLEASTQFAQKGIRPTQQAIESYTRDVKVLAMQTGMSAEAASSFYNEIHNDIDSITLLRAAREDEREAILKSQRAMVQNAIAAGMSAEQAKEAAKMLNKMVAAKPLDRIKQAAKIRAIGGALGIAGAGEAADAVIAGKRATAQQKQSLMTFNQNATNTVDQAAQKGLGPEIFANALVDKMGLDTQFGPGSPFSTTLGTVLAKPLEQTIASFAEASKSLVGEALQKMDIIVEQLKQIANGTIVMNAVVSGFQSIFKFFSGENASNWISDGLRSAIPDLADAIGDVLGLAVDAVMSNVKTVIGLITGAIGAVMKLVTLGNFGDTLLKLAKDNFSDAGEHAGNIKNFFVGPQFAKGDKTVAKPSAPTSNTPRAVQTATTTDTQQTKADEEAKNIASDTASASKDTASGIQTQLKKMDDNAILMQKLVANSDRAVELAERQLIAMTMTEKQRTEGAARADLRRDNRFGAQYQYL